MGRWAQQVTMGALLTGAVLLVGCTPAVVPGTTPGATPASGSPVAGSPVAGSPVAGSPAASAWIVPARELAPIGATEPARVVRVVDGDTIIIDRGRGNERLRYIGIDTPESVKPDSPVEFMAREASAANAALVDGRDVILETDVSDRDPFNRLLRYVWLRDEDAWVFVNRELVRQGFAQVATYPPDVRWRDDLAAAQRAAREAGAGLWGSATPGP